MGTRLVAYWLWYLLRDSEVAGSNPRLSVPLICSFIVKHNEAVKSVPLMYSFIAKCNEAVKSVPLIYSLIVKRHEAVKSTT